jgi:hypothetical protein
MHITRHMHAFSACYAEQVTYAAAAAVSLGLF